MLLVVKTPRGLEYVAAGAIRDRCGDVDIEIRPSGYLGLLIVKGVNKEDLLDIPEIERIIPVLEECKADLNEIVSKAENIVEKIGKFETFAIRTVRRGKKHNFTSTDVNIRLGAKIKELTDADVCLDFPEKAIYVEIIGDRAYIGAIDGKEERKKYTPDKFDSRKILEKISVVQVPYLETLTGAREIGERIGRAAQSFELKELIIAPYGYVDAFELAEFIKGVRKGRASRLEIQRRSYAREVREVPVYVQDLYQTVRDKRRKNNLLIVTDPTGKQIADVKDELKRKIKFAKEVVVFIGSRQGIPKGVFRLADYIIDLAPYITFATEQAIPAAVIALITICEEEEEKI